jgi:hypothetical protein
VFRTVKRRSPVTGASYPWLVPGSGVVNQYYFCCAEEEFGPVCVKFSGYFPYTGQLIRGNLDLGRPDRVALIFDRKIMNRRRHLTPGRFRTRVITDGVARACMSTTRTRKSSNTTRWAKRSGPKPPSTTRATSAWPRGCLIFPS